MRSTGETEIHQSCPELFDDGSKNNFEKYYIYEVNRVGGRRLGLWAHQAVDKDCCFSSSLLSRLSAFDVFVIRLAKSPTDVSFVSSFKIYFSISTQGRVGGRQLIILGMEQLFKL